MSDDLRYNPYKAKSLEGGVQVYLLNVIDNALQGNPDVSRAEMTARAMARRRWFTPQEAKEASAWSARQAKDYEQYLQSPAGSAMLANYERGLQARFGPVTQPTGGAGPSSGGATAGPSAGPQILVAAPNPTYADMLNNLKIANARQRILQVPVETTQRPVKAPNPRTGNATGTNIAPANGPSLGNTDAGPPQSQNNPAATGRGTQRLDASRNGQGPHNSSSAQPPRSRFDSTANSVLRSVQDTSDWLDLFLGIPEIWEEGYDEALNRLCCYNPGPDHRPSIRNSERQQAVAENDGGAKSKHDTDVAHQARQGTEGKHEAGEVGEGRQVVEQEADDGVKPGSEAEAVRGSERLRTDVDPEPEEHTGDVERTHRRAPEPGREERAGDEATGGTFRAGGAAADASEDATAPATGGEVGGHVVAMGGRQSEEAQDPITATTAMAGSRIIYDDFDDEHNIEEDDEGNLRLNLSNEGINQMF